uniref:Uncharacterized protein n=1 Tax=Prymnesium polylepis TaxID=72548 RepID=A0A7S4ICF1_9EUKA
MDSSVRDEDRPVSRQEVEDEEAKMKTGSSRALNRRGTRRGNAVAAISHNSGRKSQWDIFAAQAANDLGQPELATEDLSTVKLAAAERVKALQDSLEQGSSGPCQFTAAFQKAWPYAQGHFGKPPEEEIKAFPHLQKSVMNHPLALQHGEFQL